MRSWCFDSQAIVDNDGNITYDREYGSAELREVVGKLIGNGVYAEPATNMQVLADGSMDVNILPGCCWIRGAYGIVDQTETLTMEPSNSGRVDVVVARFDLSLAHRSIRLAVLKGTEGSTAVPSLVRNETTYDIQLARINIHGGSNVVKQSDIADTRFDSDLCGIVTGVIDQIDTTNLFAQFQAAFDEYMQSIREALTDDVAGGLLKLIEEHTHEAAGLAYDNAVSGLKANTTQEAIDELAALIMDENSFMFRVQKETEEVEQ